MIYVPMLTNSVAVSKGEELILEIIANSKGESGQKQRFGRFSELQKAKDYGAKRWETQRKTE